MKLYIQFSSADVAEKFKGTRILSDIQLIQPIFLDGKVKFNASDDYDECGPGGIDETYMQKDFSKIKSVDPRAEIACVTNFDEGSGYRIVVYSKSDSEDVIYLSTQSYKVDKDIGSSKWFSLCEELMAEDEEFMAEDEEFETFEDSSDEDKWMSKYGEYVESDPTIDFEGKNFVFTGLSWHAEEREHPIVLDVIARGGEYRSKVSGKTDYLVVDPSGAGDSKIQAVIEQVNKGKDIKVVLLRDLKHIL